ELESARATNALKERSENPQATGPAPEKKDGTTQTVDSDKGRQNEVPIIVLTDSEDDETDYGTPIDTVNEEADDGQSEQAPLKSAAKRP
ncbi:hypothetical protein PFISCL1PPCAC_22301, partial [Pristionchus fissidentatus]